MYCRRQAGRCRDYIGPTYSTPPFMQREHGLGSVLTGLFRTLRLILWSGSKFMDKKTLRALGRKALRTGGKILTDIAENPQTGTQVIIPKHVTELTQKIIRYVEAAVASEREHCPPRLMRKNAGEQRPDLEKLSWP